MFADFAGVCFDQLANQVAKYRYMSGGQARVPLTIRMANGAGAGFAAQHSQPAENWFLNIPGLKIAVPGTVADLYGLLRSAIKDDNPVLVFEHKNLFSVKGRIPAGAEALVPLGRAAVVRDGGDATIVATQQMRYRALAAADELAAEGIRAAVIDPRTLVPFDLETVLASLRRTSRLCVVQEAPEPGSWGASLVAAVASRHLELLDAAPTLLSTPDTPVPYAGNLEEAWLPQVEQIVAAVRKLVAY
jgi:pyruvate/2-oxoglutarate/acetoin dehydrogenase E1 component